MLCNYTANGIPLPAFACQHKKETPRFSLDKLVACALTIQLQNRKPRGLESRASTGELMHKGRL